MNGCSKCNAPLVRMQYKMGNVITYGPLHYTCRCWQKVIEVEG